jgi:molybdenum cofactor biosynthesis enzyme MoaA
VIGEPRTYLSNHRNLVIRTSLRRVFGPALRRYPALWKRIIGADVRIERARHSAGRILPVMIQPEARHLEISITSHCNLRCIGCRYGRDFMTGTRLDLETVRMLLDDAKALGTWDVRFYGGEPLLHRDLAEMVRHAIRLGLRTHITTNGILLGRRIDELYDAGLRDITIGYYGTGARYDAYVQRAQRFRELEASVVAVRKKYGDTVNLRINWLLMRPSCNRDDLQAAWSFAKRYDMRMQIDLVHYSLPYFSEGPDRMLQFRPEDEPAIRDITAAILELKQAEADRINLSEPGIRSIPEWLLEGPDMRVPCDAYQMLWVGPDGTVQLCYVTFRLGNLKEQRLSEMLFNATHRKAARDAFALNCPNCHCHYDRRVSKHAPTHQRYAV